MKINDRLINMADVVVDTSADTVRIHLDNGRDEAILSRIEYRCLLDLVSANDICRILDGQFVSEEDYTNFVKYLAVKDALTVVAQMPDLMIVKMFKDWKA